MQFAGIIKLTLIYMVGIVLCFWLNLTAESWVLQCLFLIFIITSVVFKNYNFPLVLLIFTFAFIAFKQKRPTSITEFPSAYCKIEKTKSSTFQMQIFCSCKYQSQYFKSIIYYKGQYKFKRGETYFMNTKYKRHVNQNLKSEFSYSHYLNLQGIYYESRPEKWFYFKKVKAIDALSKHHYIIRDWIDKQLRIAFNPDKVSIILALCFGDKSLVDENTYQYFKKAGLMHLIAVSGLHVGLIQFVLLFILRLIFGRRAKSLMVQQTLVVILLICFAWICQFSLSIVRSILMFSILYFSILTRKIAYPIYGLFLSALIMLLYNPLQLFNLGFQFSYLATFGLLLSGSLMQRWTGFIRFRILRWIIQASLISFIAQFFLSPLLFYYFGELPVWFLFFNIPGFIFVSVVICLVILYFAVLPLGNVFIKYIVSAINVVIDGFNLLLKLIDYTNILFIHFSLNTLLEVLVYCIILILFVSIIVYKQWYFCKFFLLSIIFLLFLDFVNDVKNINLDEVIIWNTNKEQAITYKEKGILYYSSSYSLPIDQRILNYSNNLNTILKRQQCTTSNYKEVSYLYPIKVSGQDTIVCVLFNVNNELTTYFRNAYPDKYLKYMYFKGGYNNGKNGQDIFLPYGPNYLPKHYDVFLYP